ncbi:MAG: hypothetical protein H6719_14100 [Sandaracinaceae bacterium]|nr:hypothetical protein [Sandaracinaceae bacterium]
MKNSAACLVLFAVLLAPSALAAQDDVLPPGHPPIDGQAAPPSGGMPQGHPASTGGTATTGVPNPVQRALQPPASAEARESADVPAGTIRVLVVDEAGDPVPDQAVDVGMLASGERERRNGRTGPDGIATFADLPVGSEQHYRVNVPHEGATYSTMPFALSNEAGHSVRVVRMPVTTDAQQVFFRMFRTVVELRGDRMHVIHQGELTNAGSATYVFGNDGVRAELPDEALAFQFQRVITDQRIEEIEDEHAYALRGSLPPGTVRLAWAYDVPVGGGDLDIPVDIPMPFFAMQVIVEAVPELGVSVRGMDTPQRLDVNGAACVDSLTSEGCAWVVQTQRAPSDGRLERIVIRLTGIPGPGPVRMIAAFLLPFFLIGGFILFLTARATGKGAAAREARRVALLDEAELLAEELASGEVGPEYAARRRNELIRELAGLYYADEVVSAKDDDAEEAHATRRPGVGGFLLPSKGAPEVLRYVELALTVAALPALILGTLFVAIKPRATLSMQGHGELVISLVLGPCSLVLAYMGASMAWPADSTIVWSVLGGTAFAAVLRSILRHAPPPAPARAAS